MMIDPPRDNFHIIFFISVGNAKMYAGARDINHIAQRNYLLCNVMCMQSCFELLTNVIKIFSLWEISSESLSSDFIVAQIFAFISLQIVRLAAN